MKLKLLEYLVCSVCQSELDLETQESRDDGEIVNGKLTCKGCQRTYPVLRGIPRMIPGQVESEQQKTAEAFGWEWQHFDDFYADYEEDLFLEWIQPIPREFFRDKVVLDGGCGTGRHTLSSSRFGAQEVIGIDLSDAVETAYRTVGHLPNAHIVQADIYQLPFRRGSQAQFDFIYSIGVLHHTPDPKKSFLSLVPLLKAGGTIFGWVYGHENNGLVHYGINPLRKLLTSRMPPKMLYYFALFLATILTGMVKGIYRPVNEKPGLQRFKKYLYYNSYFYHISKFDFRHIHTIVHDHLTAPVAFYIKREEFESWFKQAGLEQIELSWRNQNSWRGRGLKPQVLPLLEQTMEETKLPI